MEKRWSIYPHDAVQIQDLERSAGVPAVLARLLLCRGLDDPRMAREFLDPKLSGLRDPDQLPGVSQAAQHIFAATQTNRPITVFGDYDADGMVGTALLYRCLKLMGATVDYYVPNRLDEGYGLSDEALRMLSKQGTQVVISVDCGIASLQEAETARDLGLELIITDHHAMRQTLPQAAAIVHPQLPGHDYPFAGLCGAAVAFKLAWALCQLASGSQKVAARYREFLLSSVGLVALATVADVVPLLDENRVLVKHGLGSLKERPNPGMAQLLRVTELDRKPFLQSEDLAFTLAPRLNAAGRLGQAGLGVELLVTDSDQRATVLAKHIHELNIKRDSLERSVYLAANKQATEQFDPEHDPALVLAGHGWHAGVIGIVAGRLAEKYHRPVVLISLDELGVKPGVGSGRGAGVLNLNEAFAHCGAHLVSHGGHAAAAGLRVTENNLAAFRTDFCEYGTDHIAAEDRVACVQIDAETSLAALTLNTVKQIERLSPFGQGNLRPTLSTTNVTLEGSPRKMGGGDRHFSAKIKQHELVLRAVAFGKGEWADELAQLEGPIDIAYRPVINAFRGRRSVELQLVDWRPSQVAAAVSNSTS